MPLQRSRSADLPFQEKAELFGEILADLQDLYVDPVDLDKLAETGFQAMLTSLDPYTEFGEYIFAPPSYLRKFMAPYSYGLVVFSSLSVSPQSDIRHPPARHSRTRIHTRKRRGSQGDANADHWQLRRRGASDFQGQGRQG